MNFQPLIPFVALAGMLATVICGVLCLILVRRVREAKNNQLVLASEIDSRLKEVAQQLDTVTHRTAEQWQRLAQLESVTRTTATQTVVAAVTAERAEVQPSVTERRRRVIKLAQRGMDVPSIARSLGVPYGEVSLIIGLNNPTFGDELR